MALKFKMAKEFYVTDPGLKWEKIKKSQNNDVKDVAGLRLVATLSESSIGNPTAGIEKHKCKTHSV